MFFYSHEGEEDDNFGDEYEPYHAQSVVSRAGQQPLDNPMPPPGLPGSRFPYSRPTRGPRRQQLDSDYRPRIQALTGIQGRSSGIQSRKQLYIPAQPTRPRIQNEARREYEAGSPSVATHTLAVPWGSFLKNLPRARFDRKMLPAQVARELLDEICNRTNTFILDPPEASVQLEVWGTEEDVHIALKELQAFERDVRTRGERPSREHWTKEKAHDGRVEDRALRSLRQQNEQAAMYDYNQQIEFQFEAYLLWPSKLDMKAFRQRYDQDGGVLKKLQGTTACKISFGEGKRRYVKVSATEERHLHAIYQRIVNLVRETIASETYSARYNRFRVPPSSLCRDKVAMDRHLERADLSIPTLFGNGLQDWEMLKWEQLRKKVEAHTNDMLRNELDSIIRTIQAPGQHVRMRVAFTELGFSRYETPLPGQEHHGIEDFMEMIVKPQVEIRDAGLRSGSDLSQIVDVLSHMEQFTDLENRYIIHVDFSGDRGSTLRYERELYEGFEGELEDHANRWLLYSDTPSEHEILEFNVLDFEYLRANYQVHIGKVALHAPKDRYRKFEHGVTYKNDSQGIKAEAKRRAVFPPGYQELHQHTEISIARFKFKGPDARLELIRKDTFVGSQSGKKPTFTTWSAQYYYPEWDNLLGEFGDLQPGDAVSWDKRMKTFFIPRDAFDDTRPLPRGFEKFTEEIGEIQKCLQMAITTIEQTHTEQKVEEILATTANGGNGSVEKVTDQINGMTVG